MTQPFLGQIQMFGFNFAPRGWALCNGQILSISQNTALFSLLGTQYGGNGTTNFALPNLQSRVAMHVGTDTFGNNYVQGEQGGEETVQLIISEIPSHNHAFSGTASNANDKRPKTGAAFAQTTKPGPVSPGDNYYAQDNSPTVTAINPNTVAAYGAGSRHNNLQPYLTVNFCIAMAGIFPARN
jgi:microcystin-dependent protein